MNEYTNLSAMELQDATHEAKWRPGILQPHKGREATHK